MLSWLIKCFLFCQVHEKDQALSTSQNTLNSSLRREEAACNASTEKDLTLLRVNAELQQANAKIDALNKEVSHL